MSHSLVAALRSRGIDILTVLETGLTKATDAEQLEFAASQGRVIYSFNVQDFYQLHTEILQGGGSHTGIVLCQQQQFSVGEQMRRTLKLSASLTAEEMVDRIEFLGAWS